MVVAAKSSIYYRGFDAGFSDFLEKFIGPAKRIAELTDTPSSTGTTKTAIYIDHSAVAAQAYQNDWSFANRGIHSEDEEDEWNILFPPVYSHKVKVRIRSITKPDILTFIEE